MTAVNQVGNTLTGVTGTGTFVGANTPTLITPNIGAATGTSLTVSGGIQSTGSSILSGSAGGGYSGFVGAYSITAAKGYLAIQAANNAGNYGVTLTNASFGQDTVITLPDPGASTATIAYTGSSSSGYVLLAPSGDQTITGGHNIFLASGGGFYAQSGGAFSAQSLTSSKGQLILQCVDNAANYSNILTNASTSAARTWTFPDATGTVLVTGTAINSVPSIVLSSSTAYAVICGGTTSSNPLQSVSGVGTSGQVLTSNGASALPTWQTSSTGSGTVNSGTANQIAYYATSGTAVSGLTGGNNTVLITDNSGVPSMLANGTAGYVLTANSGAPPSWQAAGGGGGFAWAAVAGTTQSAAVNTGYVIQNSSQTTVTLPATAALGSVVAVQGLGSAGWILAANTGQTISFGSTATSSGGSFTSASRYDTIQVVCIVANTTWSVSFAVSAGLTAA